MNSKFDIPNWNVRQRAWRPPNVAVCIYGTRSCYVVGCFEQRTRRSSQYRHCAGFREYAEIVGDQSQIDLGDHILNERVSTMFDRNCNAFDIFVGAGETNFTRWKG